MKRNYYILDGTSMGIYYTSSKSRKEHSRDAYRLLNFVLKKEYGICDGVFEKTPEGKPYIANYPYLYISVSHTDGYVMCAVNDTPVGVDIQRKIDVSHRVIQRTCGEDELESFDFFSLWSLKESYIKLMGKLSGSYRDMVFSSHDGKPVCFDNRVFPVIYDISPDYSCASCCFGHGIEELPIFILDTSECL